MAKNTTTPAAGSHAADANTATDGTTTVAIPASLTATAHGAELPIATLPMATLAYLLLNGFSQSMTDAGTTAAARAKEAAIKEANATRGKGNEMTKAQAQEFLATNAISAMVDAAAQDARNKRVEALLAGTMVYGARGPNGPRKSPIEAFCWAAAEADAKAMAARKGKPMPKGEALETLLTAIVAAKRAEYEARFRATNTDDDALGELFA